MGHVGGRHDGELADGNGDCSCEVTQLLDLVKFMMLIHKEGFRGRLRCHKSIAFLQILVRRVETRALENRIVPFLLRISSV